MHRVSVTMMNTGSEIWTAAEGYRLGSQSPLDNMIWGSTSTTADFAWATVHACARASIAACAAAISWHAAVLSGTARLFVPPGNGAPLLFACGSEC
jgi:hypothetical protein